MKKVELRVRTRNGELHKGYHTIIDFRIDDEYWPMEEIELWGNIWKHDNEASRENLPVYVLWAVLKPETVFNRVAKVAA